MCTNALGHLWNRTTGGDGLLVFWLNLRKGSGQDWDTSVHTLGVVWLAARRVAGINYSGSAYP